MAKSKKLTKRQIRERQAAAGRASAGPRRAPEGEDRVSAKGYVQPGRYKGTRNAERNAKIVKAIEAGQTKKQVAARYGLSVVTVEQIVRYA